MITWMQTHKKWLIITIWIATIAFVGAGFVGWGAYSYGKKENSVAKVKDTVVTLKDVQDIYSNMFAQLNQAMGGRLDEATAKKLGLVQSAFKKAITRAILIQFAKDNGIYITKEELAKAIMQDPHFIKNNKFDEKLYKSFLAQNNLKPYEYENRLKEDLYVEKILTALSTPAHKITIDTIADLILMKDKVKVKIINAPKIHINEKELKAFWEKHKNDYKSPVTYNIGYYYLDINNKKVTENELKNFYEENKLNYTDKNGKILAFEKVKDKVKFDLLAKKSKKDAIITMKKLKKGELQFKIAKNVTILNQYIDVNNMQKLIDKKFLKPTLTKKGYLIAKLIKVNKPHTLTFEEAKNFVKNDLIIKKRKDRLIKLAKNSLNKITNKDLGFIARDDTLKLSKFLNISLEEANILLNAIFSSTKNKNYVLLNDKKIAVFEILEQKLFDKNKFKKYKNNIIISANQIKENTLQNNLISVLMKLYESEIKIYMKL